MGYARIFWISEEPIRRFLAQNDKDDAFFEEIGRKVLAISKGNSPQPFFDDELTFFPCRSFHSTDFCVLVWTGQRLDIVPMNELDAKQFDFLCSMQQQIGSQHVITAMPKKERDLAVAALRGWKNPLENAGEYSIYWIYEDFFRDYTRKAESEWPCKDVGVAISELMLSNWDKSQNIKNHGGAISRACTFLKTEMCFFVWSLNCLRLLGNIESSEIQKMREYLSDNN